MLAGRRSIGTHTIRGYLLSFQTPISCLFQKKEERRKKWGCVRGTHLSVMRGGLLRVPPLFLLARGGRVQTGLWASAGCLRNVIEVFSLSLSHTQTDIFEILREGLNVLFPILFYGLFKGSRASQNCSTLESFVINKHC